MRALVTTLALTGILAGAGPAAAAEPVRYTGTTNAGHDISFRLAGNKLSRIDAYVPTTCIPARGVPRAGAEIFKPPGSFRFGRARKVTALQTPVLHYADVTKHYRVTLSKNRRGSFSGRLHVNFSFLTVDFPHGTPALNPWVCRGDDRFRAHRD